MCNKKKTWSRPVQFSSALEQAGASKNKTKHRQLSGEKTRLEKSGLWWLSANFVCLCVYELRTKANITGDDGDEDENDEVVMVCIRTLLLWI